MKNSRYLPGAAVAVLALTAGIGLAQAEQLVLLGFFPHKNCLSALAATAAALALTDAPRIAGGNTARATSAVTIRAFRTSTTS